VVLRSAHPRCLPRRAPGLLAAGRSRCWTLYFAPGKTAPAVMVPIVGETVHEANETLFLKLSGASTNARIADAIGTGTIINND
jgi:hypothetical protein